MVNDGGKGRHTIVYKTQGEKVRSATFMEFMMHIKRAFQVLRNAMGDRVANFPEKSVTKVYGLMLIALQGGGGCQFSRKKCFA